MSPLKTRLRLERTWLTKNPSIVGVPFFGSHNCFGDLLSDEDDLVVKEGDDSRKTPFHLEMNRVPFSYHSLFIAGLLCIWYNDNLAEFGPDAFAFCLLGILDWSQC